MKTVYVVLLGKKHVAVCPTPQVAAKVIEDRAGSGLDGGAERSDYSIVAVRWME